MGADKEANIEHVSNSSPLSHCHSPVTTNTACSTTLDPAAHAFQYPDKSIFVSRVEEKLPPPNLQDTEEEEEEVGSQAKGKPRSKKQVSLVILEDKVEAQLGEWLTEKPILYNKGLKEYKKHCKEGHAGQSGVHGGHAPFLLSSGHR